MKTTPRQFSEQIEAAYGSELAAKFLKAFQDPDFQEISLERAMTVLDQVSLGEGNPTFPSRGATNSPSDDGSVFEPV